MKLRSKLFAVAAAAASITAVGVAPHTVLANSPVDVLEFHTSPAVAQVCWVMNNCGSSLTYTFNTNGGACEGVDVNVGVPAVGGCSVTSSGNFTNIVCGTGQVTAGSTATITESDGDVYSADIAIIFVAGLGVEHGTATDTTGGGSGPTVGVVQIAPTDIQSHVPPSVNGTCTDGFTVEAIAAVVEP
jgi:hypothetical protein